MNSDGIPVCHSLVTLVCMLMEVPRSPVSTPPSQLPYWAIRGLSRPY